MAPRKGPPLDPFRGILPDPLNPVRTLRVVGRLVRKVTKKPGSPPGTLVHTGVQRMEEVRIRVLDYGEDRFEELDLDGVEASRPFVDSPSVTWINVDGLHDLSVIEGFGAMFGLHPLVMEDILSVGQRPKVEEHEGYLFVEMNMLHVQPETFMVHDEQLSLVIGPNWILSFQEHPGDVLETVRERLRAGKGKIRSRGPDYLAYALMDAVVDSYFSVLEAVGNQVEALEDDVLEASTPDTMRRIHDLRREMIVIRKSVWPVRDVMASLLRIEGGVIRPETHVFLRDVYDHAVQLIDTVENLRDVVGGLMDLYLSTLSHRTNEVMKVLTIMATIFIPLTFIAGIYGMNFDVMPELHQPWGYPAVWGVMIVVAGGLLVYFRRKGWL